MADDLSLLFRLRGDASGVKAASAEARAAVNQLKNSFGPELTQTVTVANRAFANIADNLNVFVSQRIPLVGGAFVRITENVRGFGQESAKAEKAIAGVAKSIQSISTESGKSVPQIGAFLAKFVQIEGQAKRDKAAIDFFGVALGAKLLPELEKTGVALAALSAESAAASGALAGLATPIGIVVVAIAALVAGLALTARELFEISKRAAEFQGRMFDLAQQTGVQVETLSALEIVARTTGGEIGNLTQALITFQRRLADTSDPTSKAAQQLDELNISARDTEGAFRQAFAALAAMPEGFQQTNAAAEIFGTRGGKQVLAIIKETNGDLDGAIKRFRELGILIEEGDARAADKFNDELALLEFQIRSMSAVLARDLIPELTKLIRAFADVVRAGKPLLEIIATIAKPIVKVAADNLRAIGLAVQALTLDYEGLAKAIKEAQEQQDIKPIAVPAPAPVPLPGPPSPERFASDEVNAFAAVVAIAKRQVATENELLNVAFQQGRINRERHVQATIDGNKRILNAEQGLIDAQLRHKEIEIEALDEAQQKRGEVVRRDTDAYRVATAEVGKLQQERLNKEAEFERSSVALRAASSKDRADAIRKDIADRVEIDNGEFDRQIKATEAAIAGGSAIEADGLTIIEALERGKIDARREGLEEQKRIGFLTIAEQQSLNDQINKLNQDADRLADEQEQRRLARLRAAAVRVREAKLADLDTQLELEQIIAERLIASNEALAEARVQSEEQAAQKILAIRLGLIDSEVEATKTRLSAAASITDVDERTRIEAELNNRLKILIEQRVSIQTQGERDLEEGRRRDVENARQYADELAEIQERIVDLERDAAEEVVRLMVIHFASRRDIIRARLQLDIEDENARHRNAQQGIAALRLENAESNRTQAEKLAQEQEINRLEEAEAERHRLVLQGIRDQGKKDEAEADPLGRFTLDTESLRQFASVIESSIIPLGEVLRGTFQGVADAIGQTVANWVLLGTTGPAVMRKILAQALASLAAEAAVNAIKELALGFATLFFNPAESAAHFTAAALWGSIGLGSALIGRSVAGNLFKPTAGGGAAGGSGRGESGELNPLNLARNAGPGAQQQFAPQVQPVLVTVNVVPDGSRFGSAVTAHVVDDFNNAGPIREVSQGDGNLNRG